MQCKSAFPRRTCSEHHRGSGSCPNRSSLIMTVLENYFVHAALTSYTCSCLSGRWWECPAPQTQTPPTPRRGWNGSPSAPPVYQCMSEMLSTQSERKEKKRKEKTTPFGVNSRRSQVLYQAAHETAWTESGSPVSNLFQSCFTPCTHWRTGHTGSTIDPHLAGSVVLWPLLTG